MGSDPLTEAMVIVTCDEVLGSERSNIGSELVVTT